MTIDERIARLVSDWRCGALAGDDRIAAAIREIVAEVERENAVLREDFIRCHDLAQRLDALDSEAGRAPVMGPECPYCEEREVARQLALRDALHVRKKNAVLLARLAEVERERDAATDGLEAYHGFVEATHLVVCEERDAYRDRLAEFEAVARDLLQRGHSIECYCRRVLGDPMVGVTLAPGRAPEFTRPPEPWRCFCGYARARAVLGRESDGE